MSLILFLGVKVLQFKDGLFLSQRTYILKLLEKFSMYNAKPNATHMKTSTQLKINYGSGFTDPTQYR